MSLPIYRSPATLGNKYRIYDRDCNPCPDEADYFVLRLDSNGDNRPHHVASLAAAAAYARAIRGTEFDQVGVRLNSLVKTRRLALKVESVIDEPEQDDDDEPIAQTTVPVGVRWLPVVHPQQPLTSDMRWSRAGSEGMISPNAVTTLGEYKQHNPSASVHIPQDMALPGTCRDDVYVGDGWYPLTNPEFRLERGGLVQVRSRGDSGWSNVMGFSGSTVGEKIINSQFRISRQHPMAIHYEWNAIQSSGVGF